MSGTDLAYGPICLRDCYALPSTGTDLAYGPTRLYEAGEFDFCGKTHAIAHAIAARDRYQPTSALCADRYSAMHGATSLCAMGGTELAYDATREI
eukprot:2987739-Rhodomonas_salina.1